MALTALKNRGNKKTLLLLTHIVVD